MTTKYVAMKMPMKSYYDQYYGPVLGKNGTKLYRVAEKNSVGFFSR